MELEQPSGDSAVVDETTPPVETTTDVVDEPQFDENGLPIEAAPVDDNIEEEVDGVKLKGKKEAVEQHKSKLLMQADYTRKTQEVAEGRKAFEAERAHFQQTAQTHQQHIREVAALVNIEERLEEFAKAGITPQSIRQLADTDPVQALKLHNELIDLQTRQGQAINSITQKQHQAQSEQQRATAKQVFDAQQVLTRDIKGWSPELAGKLKDHGIKRGIPVEAFETLTNPVVVKLIHDSYLLDQLQKQRTAKPPTAPAPPATRLSGSGAVSAKEPAQMSDREFAAWRQKQIAQRK